MPAKILAVDDEPDIRRLIEIKLKKAGYEVVIASDGQEGLSKALTERPDLVLMDVMMPRMDGLTAAAQIRAQMEPAPVVIMLTAKGQSEDIDQGLAAGADDYVVKPFSPQQLLSRIEVALIRARRAATAGSQGHAGK